VQNKSETIISGESLEGMIKVEIMGTPEPNECEMDSMGKKIGSTWEAQRWSKRSW
jgi:hypothetical protein